MISLSHVLPLFTFFSWPIQFGGGKVIRPGDILETEEEKSIKEARTKQLLAAYKKEIGLNIDPKLKSECEEVSIFSGIPKYYCHSFLLLSMQFFFVIFVCILLGIFYFVVIDD